VLVHHANLRPDVEAARLDTPGILRQPVTPWPSEPCRSASAISAATVAASAFGKPSFVSASRMNAFRRSKLTVD
jgi:hypothetical protein